MMVVGRCCIPLALIAGLAALAATIASSSAQTTTLPPGCRAFGFGGYSCAPPVTPRNAPVYNNGQGGYQGGGGSNRGAAAAVGIAAGVGILNALRSMNSSGGSGVCRAGYGLCPDRTCAPLGAVCCGSGRHCPSGYACTRDNRCVSRTASGGPRLKLEKYPDAPLADARSPATKLAKSQYDECLKLAERPDVLPACLEKAAALAKKAGELQMYVTMKRWARTARESAPAGAGGVPDADVLEVVAPVAAGNVGAADPFSATGEPNIYWDESGPVGKATRKPDENLRARLRERLRAKRALTPGEEPAPAEPCEGAGSDCATDADLSAAAGPAEPSTDGAQGGSATGQASDDNPLQHYLRSRNNSTDGTNAGDLDMSKGTDVGVPAGRSLADDFGGADLSGSHVPSLR